MILLRAFCEQCDCGLRAGSEYFGIKRVME